jgi:hypothetical protein
MSERMHFLRFSLRKGPAATGSPGNSRMGKRNTLTTCTKNLSVLPGATRPRSSAPSIVQRALRIASSTASSLSL